MAKKKATIKKTKVFEFTITLMDTAPVVWRKVLAHEFIELNELHMLIQMSMGWQNTHLFSFEINGKTYSGEETAAEMENTFDADGVELCDILGESKKFTYTYDFGDDWLHEIEITKVMDDDPRMNYPVCVGGENACPPEDCGGPHGFERFKATLVGKDGQEKDEMLTWVGGFYDPLTLDPNFVNKNFLWTEDDL